MNKRLIAGGAVASIVLAVSIAWAVKRRPKPAPKPAAPVAASFLGSEITLTGRLESQATEQVDAPVAGILDAWFVDVGQEVYEDQLIGRIRNADLDSAVEQAQAVIDRTDLKIATLDAQATAQRLELSRTAADQIRARNELDRVEKIYQRQQNLMAAGATPRLTFEKAEADEKAAKAEAANRDATAKDAQDKASAIESQSVEAKHTLDIQTAALAAAKEAAAKGDLHSPADGVVLTRNVHQGEKVEEGAKDLMSIATDLTKLSVVLSPDPAVLARIHPGQHAFVRVADAETPGEVKQVQGTEVVVQFASPAPITKLGTAAQVRIVF